jgi:hypothetical protein
VEGHGLRDAVAREDQRTSVVPEQRPRDAAEVTERSGDPLPPVVLALGEEGFDEQPTRVAQDGDEHEHPHHLAGDPDELLPEVDLHLGARRRLVPDRRQLLSAELTSALLDGLLDRTQPDVVAARLEQLGQDHRVALRLRVE